METGALIKYQTVTSFLKKNMFYFPRDVCTNCSHVTEQDNVVVNKLHTASVIDHIHNAGLL